MLDYFGGNKTITRNETGKINELLNRIRSLERNAAIWLYGYMATNCQLVAEGEMDGGNGVKGN